MAALGQSQAETSAQLGISREAVGLITQHYKADIEQLALYYRPLIVTMRTTHCKPADI